MRGLNDTIARMAAMRRQRPQGEPAGAAHLSPLLGFGSNPGGLKGWTYVPESFRPGGPLVVVLHGCTQSAGSYDRGAGWSSAADEHGFALLFPEQQRANNQNLCFNWFAPHDARRGGGEALSIRQMVAAMHAQHGTDAERTFVTGLSAGGAMTAVMLSTYPELFAGGAIIAGLPFGTARSVPEAFDRMRGHGGPRSSDLAALVHKASGHKGPWPVLSVWHGSSDQTVDLSNARAVVDQWRRLHDTADAPSRSDLVHGHRHEVWTDASGRDVVELYTIAGMGHGTPLDTSGSHEGERAGPHMLEAGISSTREIARFWGLIDAKAKRPSRAAPGSERAKQAQPAEASTGGVQETIEAALRSAGLLR